MCMCVHGLILKKIALPFFHISLCLCSFSFTFLFEHIVFSSQVMRILSIINIVICPFPKVCGNCHVANVTIFLAGGVCCNAYHLKWTVQKLGFLRGSVATNDEHVLFTIKGKWFETIMHMIESKFLDLLHPKEVQLLI